MFTSGPDFKIFMREKIFKRAQLKSQNEILIALHMRGMNLERIHHRPRILIKCRERCRDAIWWSNLSQAVKRNVLSLRAARTPQSLITAPWTPLPGCWRWQAAGVTEKLSRVHDIHLKFSNLLARYWMCRLWCSVWHSFLFYWWGWFSVMFKSFMLCLL